MFLVFTKKSLIKLKNSIKQKHIDLYTKLIQCVDDYKAEI